MPDLSQIPTDQLVQMLSMPTVGQAPKAPPQPVATKPQPQTFWDHVKGYADDVRNFASGVDVGKDDLPASIMGLVPRATDAVGLTHGAYPAFHAQIEDMNRETHPRAYNGSNASRFGRIAGGALVTLPIAGAAPIKAAGILADAGNAALGGAASAVGTSQASDDPLWEQAGIGAVGGAALGGAISAGGRVLAHTLAPAAPAADQALSYIQRLMRSSGRAPDAASLRSTQAASLGKPITSAEAIGSPGEVALGALARRPGTTPDQFAGLMAERNAGAPSRMLDDFASAGGVHPAAARGDIDALVSAGRAQAKPAYQTALNQAPVTTDRLAQFANEPIIQRGMANGIKIERLKALANGEPFDPQAYAITHFNEAGDPVIGGVPTWRTWDAAKTGLDDMLDQYRDKTTGRLVLDKMGYAIGDVRKSMLNELDSVNPAYKSARGIAGDYLSASDAFDKGGKALLNQNLTEQQFGDMVGRLSQSELEAFKGGIANQAFNLAQSGRLNPKIFASPRVQAKLSIALGPDKAASLLSSLQSEGRMATFARQRVPGANSPTAEYSAAMRDQDGAPSYSGDLVDMAKRVAAQGPVRVATSAAIDRVGRFASNYATRGMSQPVRDYAGSLLMMSPSDLAKTIDSAGPTGYVGGRVPSYAERIASSVRRNVHHVASSAGIVAPGAVAAVGLK